MYYIVAMYAIYVTLLWRNAVKENLELKGLTDKELIRSIRSYCREDKRV